MMKKLGAVTEEGSYEGSREGLNRDNSNSTKQETTSPRSDAALQLNPRQFAEQSNHFLLGSISSSIRIHPALLDSNPMPKYSNLSFVLNHRGPTYKQIVSKVDSDDHYERKKIKKVSRFNHQESTYLINQQMKRRKQLSPLNKTQAFLVGFRDQMGETSGPKLIKPDPVVSSA
jgi:hypothetical protein